MTPQGRTVSKSLLCTEAMEKVERDKGGKPRGTTDTAQRWSWSWKHRVRREGDRRTETWKLKFRKDSPTPSVRAAGDSRLEGHEKGLAVVRWVSLRTSAEGSVGI